jgi:hypothetical protein
MLNWTASNIEDNFTKPLTQVLHVHLHLTMMGGDITSLIPAPSHTQKSIEQSEPLNIYVHFS